MSITKTDMKYEIEWAKINQILHLATPKASAEQVVYLKQLVFSGLEAASTLFELAIANVGGLHHEPTDGRDFSDGSDAKLAVVRMRSNGNCYSAKIDNKNKTGYLRIGVYERVRNKMYYFLIPPEIHQDHRSLEIKFNKETHLPASAKKGRDWWQFQVNSIDDVSEPVNSLQSSSLPVVATPQMTPFTVRQKQKALEKQEEAFDALFTYN